MKKSEIILYAAVLLMLITQACLPVTPAPIPTIVPTATVKPPPPPTSTSNVQQYLSDAIDIIQKNALNSKNVDWEKVRAMALVQAKDAKRPQDTYDTISYVLRQLEDHHSAFLTPDAASQLNNSTVEDYLQPNEQII